MSVGQWAERHAVNLQYALILLEARGMTPDPEAWLRDETERLGTDRERIVLLLNESAQARGSRGGPGPDAAGSSGRSARPWCGPAVDVGGEDGLSGYGAAGLAIAADLSHAEIGPRTRATAGVGQMTS